tara:strand:+ start:1024 stop:1188 length:165 start_codon:yes stop_codon:yes gene_type:complete
MHLRYVLQIARIQIPKSKKRIQSNLMSKYEVLKRPGIQTAGQFQNGEMGAISPS